MINTRRYFLFIATMLMLVTFLPLAYVHLPPLIRSYHVWALLWGLSLLVFKPQVFSQKLMIIVEIYGCYLVLMLNTFYSSMDAWNVHQLWIDYYSIVVAVSIISYFDFTNDYDGLAKLTKYTLLFIFITAVLTILTSIIYPSYSRAIVTFDDYGLIDTNLDLLYRLQNLGAGTRGDGFGFMAIIPLAIYYFKNNQLITNGKIWILLFIFTCIIACWRMQFMALLLYTIVFAILALISPKNRKIMILTFSILTLIILSIPSQIFVNIFENLSYTFSGLKDLSSNFKDIALYIECGGGVIEGNSVSDRIDVRYLSSLKYFGANPFFGTFFLNNSEFGYLGEGHLFLMNKLTTTGIAGFLFWGYIFLYHFKLQNKKINQEYKYFFILALLSILLYGLVKVIIVRNAWMLFFVIIPGLYYLPLFKKVKYNELD